MIVLLCDALRADAITEQWTPNIMRIASQGTYYNRAISPDSHTMGSMPHLLGFYDQMTLLEILRKHGYTTFIANTNLLVHLHFEQYFDHSLNFADKRDKNEIPAWKHVYNYFRKTLSLFADQIPYKISLMWRFVSHQLPYTTAQAALQQAYHQPCNQSPYFQWIHLMDSHNPYYPAQHGYSKWILAKYYGIIYDILQGKIEPESEVVGAMRRLYLENIQEMDEAIGKFYNQLDLQNTILIILADHGEAFGEGGNYGHPHNVQIPVLYHVPLIIIGSEQKNKMKVNLDLKFFPQTVCKVLGLPAAKKINKSWIPETVENLEQRHMNLKERLAELGYI